MDDVSKQVEMVARRVSFLMEHQMILPELQEIINTISPDTEYGRGARDALLALIGSLHEKGD
jgi:hypothetical protein